MSTPNTQRQRGSASFSTQIFLSFRAFLWYYIKRIIIQKGGFCMICPNCGTNNSDSTKFCITCGARLDAGAQQAAQQADYQPSAPVVMQPMNNQPLTTGQFFLMDLILAIPLVGLIMCFVWAFGDGSNPNRKAWAKAKLIWILIGVVLTILFVVLFAGVFASIVNRIAYSY